MPIPKAVNAALLIASFLFASPLWAEPAAASALADDCSEVRMDQGEGSVSKLPILDQGDEGLCYSYTASQLIDAWRFSHGDTNTKALSSPVYGGALYAKTYKKYYELASIERELIAKGEKQRIEAKSGEGYEKIEAHLKGYTDINNGHVKATIELLRANKYTCDSKDLFGSKLQKNFSKYISGVVEYGNRIYIDNYQDPAGKLKCDSPSPFAIDPRKPFFTDLGKVIQESHNTNELVFNLFDSHCKNKVDLSKVPPPQIEDFFRKPVESRLQTMHKLLSKTTPQPIGINYCASFLFTKAPEKCEQHSSIVIGRKKIKGQCHFLVRNTWGKTCQMKREGRRTKYQYPCDEKGQIWVPQEDLVRMTFNANWLE